MTGFLELFGFVEGEDAQDEFANDLLGLDRTKETTIERVGAVVTTDKDLVWTNDSVDLLLGRLGDVDAIRQCLIWLEAVWMSFVVDGNNVVVYDDAVAGQADDAFDKLLGIFLAIL